MYQAVTLPGGAIGDRVATRPELPRGFEMLGVNGVAARIEVKYLLTNSFRLTIKIGCYTSSIDAHRIGELRSVVQAMMRDCDTNRRYNFSFGGSTFSVFVVPRREDRQCGLVLCGVSAVYLSEDQVAAFLRGLDRIAIGINEFAIARGIISPTRSYEVSPSRQAS